MSDRKQNYSKKVKDAIAALDKYFSEGNDPKVYPYGDLNLFLSDQMNRKELTWRLKTDGKVILKGLLLEPTVSYNVSHSWSGAGGGIVSEAVNAINKVKNIARTAYMYNDSLMPTVNAGANTELEGLNKAWNTAARAINDGKSIVDNAVDSVLGNSKFGNFLRDANDVMRKLANTNIYSTGEQVKVFGGTTINVTVPELQVTVFDYKKDVTNGCSVEEFANYLNTALIGGLDTMGDIVGIQYSPNEYAPRFNIIDGLNDATIPGTYSLEIGSKYTLNNLLISGFNVKMSTLKSKRLKESNYDNLGAYMAEVSVNLEFANMVNQYTLAKLLGIATK